MSHTFFRMRIGFRGLLSAAVALACIGTLAGFLADVWWVFALAGHFRVQCFLFLAAAAVLYAFDRKPLPAVVAAIFALVNAAFVIPLYLGSTHAQAATPRYRALLANVNSRNTGHKAFHSLVTATNPHFMAVLEVTDAWVNALRPLEDRYPYTIRRSREDNFGIAFFSRLPAESLAIRDFGRLGLPAVTVRLRLDHATLTVAAVHPPPPVVAAYRTERALQMETLARYVRAERNPVMVLGDLNSTSWGPLFSRLVEQAGLVDSRRGFGVQPSWPVQIHLIPFRIPLDHCLVSDGIVIHHRRLGPRIGSDHYPVIVDFALARSTR